MFYWLIDSFPQAKYKVVRIINNHPLWLSSWIFFRKYFISINKSRLSVWSHFWSFWWNITSHFLPFLFEMIIQLHLLCFFSSFSEDRFPLYADAYIENRINNLPWKSSMLPNLQQVLASAQPVSWRISLNSLNSFCCLINLIPLTLWKWNFLKNYYLNPCKFFYFTKEGSFFFWLDSSSFSFKILNNFFTLIFWKFMTSLYRKSVRIFPSFSTKIENVKLFQLFNLKW